jgi:hypothetical protein
MAMKRLTSLILITLMMVEAALGTVSSQTSRINYTGNGGSDTYAYTFRIADDDDIDVIVRETATLEETTLTKTTHYTVSGVGNSAGGNIALVDGAFDWIDGDGDLDSGWQLTLRRKVDLTQTTSIKNNTTYYPSLHEAVFDKLTFISQQHQDELDRTMKTPWGDTVVDLTLPNVDDRAGYLLGFNSTGSPIAVTTYSGTTASSFMNTVLDDTSASAALTTLGFSAFVQTLLDDATAAAFMTTLGISSYAQTILDDTTASAARTTLGASGGVWPTDLGGTGLSSYTAGDVPYYAAGTSLSKLAIGTSGKHIKSSGTGPAWDWNEGSQSSVSADHTVSDTDGVNVFLMTTSNTSRTATLPTLADNIGRVIEFRKVDSGTGAYIVDGEGAETVDGLASVQIAFQHESIRLRATSAGWIFVGQHYQSFNTSAPSITNGGTSPAGLVKGVRVGRNVTLTAQLTTGGTGSPTNTVTFAAADVPAAFRPTIQCVYWGEIIEATDSYGYMKVATSGVLSFIRVSLVNAADVIQSPAWGNAITSAYGASYVVY